MYKVGHPTAEPINPYIRLKVFDSIESMSSIVLWKQKYCICYFFLMQGTYAQLKLMQNEFM